MLDSNHNLAARRALAPSFLVWTLSVALGLAIGWIVQSRPTSSDLAQENARLRIDLSNERRNVKDLRVLGARCSVALDTCMTPEARDACLSRWPDDDTHGKTIPNLLLAIADGGAP